MLHDIDMFMKFSYKNILLANFLSNPCANVKETITVKLFEKPSYQIYNLMVPTARYKHHLTLSLVNLNPTTLDLCSMWKLLGIFQVTACDVIHQISK